MNERAFFDILIVTWLSLAIVIFITLFFFSAPYGRHNRSGWGPAINSKLGWIIMEAPAVFVFAVCFALGNNTTTITALVFLALWGLHYVHRAFIYPFSLHSESNRMPIIVMSFAFLFNAVNGYLNGRYIFTFSSGYSDAWLGDFRFIIGLGLFVIGFIINRRADYTLRNLRKPGESGYKIPYEGLYRWISCPNYFGEIIIWVGWAVMTWSLPGLVFAIWTAANLVPRAHTHHKWYCQSFPDYPPTRKALIPWVW
jgi:3-oxo-5-alpha-steroid 4-dehydrogenase 1